MSELRSSIDALRGEVLADLPDARIEEDFAELQRAAEMIEVERLRRLAETDRRRLYERDGHLSTASWLTRTHNVGWGAARGSVSVARALDSMPITRRALDEGAISMSAVRLLVGARDADPQLFTASEDTLVEAARSHTISDLQKVTAFWRQRAERVNAHDGEQRLRERRSIHMSRTFLGMVRVDGDLDPETGETLLTALGAVMDSEARSRTGGDTRSPAQRRADALGEVCRQWLDRVERPSVGGERPHMTLTVDVDALASDGEAEFDRAGPAPGTTARRIASLGGRRSDGDIQPAAALSAASPADPPAARVHGRDGRLPAGVPKTRRIDPRGPGSAVAES
jgi:hypothetical protein